MFIVDYAQAFCDIPAMLRQLIPPWTPGRLVQCPFHSEGEGSLSLSEKGFGQCFGCRITIKNIFDLAAKLELGKRRVTHADWEKQARKWYREFVPTIERDRNNNLRGFVPLPQGAVSYLLGPRRGLTQDTITCHHLAFEKRTNRVVLPIIDCFGNIVNLRKFRWQGKSGPGSAPTYEPKVISHAKGFGSTRLFPETVARDNNRFFLAEGEWDTLVLLQHGLPAVCWTTGANSWDTRSDVFFRDKEVLLVYDDDPGGRKGAKLVAEHIARIREHYPRTQCTVVSPPTPPGFKGKDVTEWIQNDRAAIEYFRNTLKHPPSQVGSRSIPSRALSQSYSSLKTRFKTHFYIEDDRLIDVVFAALLANRFFIDAIWILIVGPAGGLKTEILRSTGKCSYIREVSKLTGQTLFSGFKTSKITPEQVSLVFQLTNKIIVMKDFTTVLDLPPETRQGVLSQLREIADGYMPSDYGHGGGVRWKGHVGFLGGVTPAVDSSLPVQSTLGERFLLWRIIPEDRNRASAQAMRNVPRTAEIREELAAHVTEFLEQFAEGINAKPLPKGFAEQLLPLGDIISYGRAAVSRSGDHVVTTRPIPEMATRAVRQLSMLGQALFLLLNSKRAKSQVLGILRKIAVDSMTVFRKEMLYLLDDEPGFGLRDISDALRLPPRTCWPYLEDLWMLGLIDKESEGITSQVTQTTDEVLLERGRWYSWHLTKQGKRLAKLCKENGDT